jgi:uncharacterized protein (TIGR00369 family)
MQGKRVQDSQLTTHQFMMPEHANHLGNVHGGVIMKLVDEIGALCAIRHAQRQVVTLVIDTMVFHSPAFVGHMISLNASVNWIGRTSLEVGVRVSTENPMTGERTHTNTAYMVYVALDDDSKPVQVPPLILETEDEHRRWQDAEARRQHRFKQSK